MRRGLSLFILIAVCCLALGLAPVDQAQAKGKNFIWSVSMAMYPEFAESHGINAVANHIYGRSLTDPALKDKHIMKVYDKGMLYPNQDEHLQAVSSGALQMTYAGPHFLEALDPAWKLGEAPGVFRDYEHFYKTMQTPTWKALHEKMAKQNNVTILSWSFDCGSWYLFTEKGPVNSLDDIKGRKIRYGGGEAFAKALKALGTTPISLPYTEVVTGLQTHMIEGLVTDFTGGVDYYDLPRYTTYTVIIPFTIQPICIIASTKWWESLDKEAREAIYHTIEIVDLQPYYARLQGRQIQKWRDDPKLTVVDPPKAEVAKWQGIMRDSIKDMIQGIDPVFMKAVDSIKD